MKDRDSQLIFETYLHKHPENLKEGWGMVKDTPDGIGPRSGLDYEKPGAAPEDIQKTIDHFSTGERRRDWNDWIDRQFEDMAAGRGLGEDRDYEVGLRNMYYSSWKNEDFQKVIDALEHK